MNSRAVRRKTQAPPRALGAEGAVHGSRWGELHGGYFSDTAVALPLVKAVRHALSRAPADVIADLGGGTGFMLARLAASGPGISAALVNVDCSKAQLAVAAGAGITVVRVSLDDFKRRDVVRGDRRLLMMMRSVLHYFGEKGLGSALRHLRDQARAGEYFVHQSASFDYAEEAACLNALYRRMRTRKWYPTADVMKRQLLEAGWRVVRTAPAPALLLTSKDLALRYALDRREVARIRDTMAREFGERSDVFRLMPSGFSAHLHYRIYICEAWSVS